MGTLYIIATPIGNLEDISLRALRVLKEVDLILCEDTRVTKKLLSYYDIHTPLKRLDAHTEKKNMSTVTSLLSDGKNIALVSDAGTPVISDPGSFLVSHVRRSGAGVIAIPGPSALTTSISAAGVPASEFLFLGFLPHKKGRETLFKEISESKRTVVFYESPHRIMKTLFSLASHLEALPPSGRQVVLARELTKIYEEFISGTPEEILKILEKNPKKQKGEFVVIVSSK